MKIGFITKFPVPFFATMENAAKAYAAANPGVEIVYGQGASATDIEGQIALIESMVTHGVQGIALTPVDPTVSTALDKAIAAGVKVVLMDNNIPDWNGRTALATTDDYAAGKIAGEYLKTVLKAGDTMGILEGVPGVPALDDRVNGMIEGLGGLDVKIVGRGATDCTEEKGISVAEDILTANPDLKSIYAACGHRRPVRRRRSRTPISRARSSSSASTSAAARPRRWRQASRTRPSPSSRPRWPRSASMRSSRRSAARRSSR